MPILDWFFTFQVQTGFHNTFISLLMNLLPPESVCVALSLTSLFFLKLSRVQLSVTPWTVAPSPRVCSDSCPLSRWCHPTILSSVIPFSSHLQSFPASRSFPMSRFFASGGQRTGASASASVLPMNIQDWSPLGWTGWISLQSKELSTVFSHTTVQKHQF